MLEAQQVLDGDDEHFEVVIAIALVTVFLQVTL